MMLEADRSIQYYIRDLQFDSKESSLARDANASTRVYTGMLCVLQSCLNNCIIFFRLQIIGKLEVNLFLIKFLIVIVFHVQFYHFYH